jgi:hypothetical protein
MNLRSLACSLLLLLPAALPGQDTKVLDEAIGNFKGMADEVRKNNPVLAAGTGEGVGNFVKSLTGRRSKGKGPAHIEVPKEQLEELERRQKARELAEQRAKRPRAVAAAPVRKAVNPAVPPINPVVMAAILRPPPKPLYTLVSEASLGQVQPGQDRETVLTALGKPSRISAITGLEDGSRETFTYNLDPQRTVAIRLQNGRVIGIQR